MFNFRIVIIVLAITGYFLARVFITPGTKKKPEISVYEQDVEFNNKNPLE